MRTVTRQLWRKSGRQVRSCFGRMRQWKVRQRLLRQLRCCWCHKRLPRDLSQAYSTSEYDDNAPLACSGDHARLYVEGKLADSYDAGYDDSPFDRWPYVYAY